MKYLLQVLLGVHTSWTIISVGLLLPLTVECEIGIETEVITLMKKSVFDEKAREVSITANTASFDV